jgi:hypothetical protein
MYVMDEERKLNHKHLTSSFHTSKEQRCEKAEKFYRLMWKQILKNGNYIMSILLLVRNCYCHNWLEQYLKQKGPLTHSQTSGIMNYMYTSNCEIGEIYNNINVIRLEECTSEYENKFTRQ